MAEGSLIGCFGLTESDAGSDPASMKTNAIEKDDGYILNGSKNLDNECSNCRFINHMGKR